MVTISDIAKETNFSISTISRVLNYDSSLSVTDETKRKIFETAERLNYHKHTKKKNNPKLKAKQTLLILQWLNNTEELNDIYYMSIRIGVEKKAAEMRFNVIKTSNIDDVETIDLCGIIGIGKFDPTTIKHICRLNKNVCFIGSNYPLEGFDTVNGDFALATELAINHLLALGHSKIGFIGVEEKENLYGHRYYKAPTTYTFIDYMESLCLFNKKFFFFTHSEGYTTSVGNRLATQAIERLNGDLPSSFVISHDIIAIGFIKTLIKNGYRIPEDISIVSINDLAVSPFVSPSLTTIKIYTESMGEAAVDLISKRLDGEKIARRVTLEPKLITRESTQHYIPN